MSDELAEFFEERKKKEYEKPGLIIEFIETYMSAVIKHMDDYINSVDAKLQEFNNKLTNLEYKINLIDDGVKTSSPPPPPQPASLNQQPVNRVSLRSAILGELKEVFKKKNNI